MEKKEYAFKTSKRLLEKYEEMIADKASVEKRDEHKKAHREWCAAVRAAKQEEKNPAQG